MSMEKLQNICEPIESDDIFEKEKEIFNRIERISLVYADIKCKENRKDNPDYKFSEAIRDYSTIPRMIVNQVVSLEGFEYSDYKEKISLYLNDFYNELDSLYEEIGFDFDGILSLIKGKEKSIKSFLGVENFIEKTKQYEKGQDERSDGTKVIRYNRVDNFENDEFCEYRVLENEGFSKSDRFVEIHAPALVTTNEKNIGLGSILNDLSIVAKHIVSKAPETAAIIGNSWLLDTAIAKKLGFKIVNGDFKEQNDSATWLQFIDKDGQIDQKRIRQFMDKEDLPFRRVVAYIPVKEFLERYLPSNHIDEIN